MCVVMVTGWVVRSGWGVRARCLDRARLMALVRVRGRRGGRSAARTAVPMGPVRSGRSAVMCCARTIWSRAAFRATVKEARSGSVPGFISFLTF